jgi:hypothetical protein
MALNKSTMANFRLAELAKAYPGIPMSGDIYEEMIKYYEADSQGIIADFLANAVVLPGSFANAGGNLAGTGKVS